jgi:hypothetical protein
VTGSKSKMVQVHVTPFLLGWQVKVNGRRVGRFASQGDADAIAIFLGRLFASATVKLHGRGGRVRAESTFPRSADPRKTKG